MDYSLNQQWIVTPRQRYDLEMLLVGGFDPVFSFLSQTDYENVLLRMRLANGSLWPIPITLDVDEEFAEKIQIGDEIKLCDVDRTLLACMHINDKWQPNKLFEAEQVFGTLDINHPGVDYLLNKAGTWYLGGSIRLVQFPKHYDFLDLRHTPKTLKHFFLKMGWQRIVGFQTRNPIHRAHMELTLRAAKQIEGHILIHPVVGLTKPGDIDYYTRVRCYQKILYRYPTNQAFLSLLPLAMRMAGPKEALWHAIIRKNYGCTHFIVGRDHADPGTITNGKILYPPFAAQELVLQYQDEIGIETLLFQEMGYVQERKKYLFKDELRAGEIFVSISGTALRQALLNDNPVPEWFSFPEVVAELRHSYLPKYKQGFTVFFTGLSGSGKTSLANALIARLMSYGKRNITLLDGDTVRQVLGSELSYSKHDRDLNIRRVGYVAAEITKVGGIAICAVIAPYAEARNANRQLISQYGGYVKVYVSTPLSICEKRDTKGLYAKARRGEIKQFTGINDPYELPNDPEIEIDTTKLGIDESINKIIDFLFKTGYLKNPIEQAVLFPQTITKHVAQKNIMLGSRI
ncbi:MAG: adenylyltransferase [Gammaproteobacteria bacterium RIFCSPHIGHO2_12_FULL_37_34]|nr:MAG: adenylyltransferase [Gammaproteobacteria bacterium RIFCSPHIGHO2_12_FULL_37_34]